MDIREIEYFKTVAEMKSFTKAANKLCVSQPSITVAIKKIEGELGVFLFDRNKKKVELTQEGKIFLQKVDKILTDLKNTILEMSEFNTIKKQIINLGLPPMIGAPLLSKLIKKYSEDEKIELIVHELGSLDIIELLEKGELDIGIIVKNDLNNNILEIQNIANGEIVVCLSKTHPLRNWKSIPLKLLKEQKFIMIEGGNSISRIVKEECKKNNFNPRMVYNFKVFDNIKNLTINEIGVSFFLKSMVENDKGLIFRSLETPLFIEIVVAWKKNKFLTKPQKELIEFMKNNYFL